MSLCVAPRPRRGSSQVDDLDVAPLPVQVLSDEPPMALVWAILAAQQAASCQLLPHQGRLDSAFCHQRKELTFVSFPSTFRFLVPDEHGLRGSEDRKVDVGNPADRLRKEPEIVLLREACELRDVVEPDVNETACARSLQTTKELLGRLLGETQSEELQRAPPFTPASAGSSLR